MVVDKVDVDSSFVNSLFAWLFNFWLDALIKSLTRVRLDLDFDKSLARSRLEPKLI